MQAVSRPRRSARLVALTGVVLLALCLQVLSALPGLAVPGTTSSQPVPVPAAVPVHECTGADWQSAISATGASQSDNSNFFNIERLQASLFSDQHCAPISGGFTPLYGPDHPSTLVQTGLLDAAVTGPISVGKDTDVTLTADSEWVSYQQSNLFPVKMRPVPRTTTIGFGTLELMGLSASSPVHERVHLATLTQTQLCPYAQRSCTYRVSRWDAAAAAEMGGPTTVYVRVPWQYTGSCGMAPSHDEQYDCVWGGLQDAYVPIAGHLDEPLSSFDAAADLSAPGTYGFLATSTDPNNEPLQYSWDFGDGTRGTGSPLTHRYGAAGTYHVLMTTTNQRGLRSQAAMTITAAAPALSVTLSLSGAAPPLDLDQHVVARITVSASPEGVGDLTDLAFSGEPLTAAPASRFTAEPVAPTPDPAGFSLSPGASRVFTVPLTAAEVGAYTLTTHLTGKDPLGTDVAATAEARGEVGRALSTVITLDPQSVTQQEDADGPKPVTVHATITLTNNTAGTIDQLNLQALEPKRTTALQVLHLVQVDGPVPDSRNGYPLPELAAGESTDIPATFTADDDGETDITALVTGRDAAGAALTSPASTRLSVKPAYLVKLTSEVSWPAAGALLPAGGNIVIRGEVKNLSNTDTLALGPLFADAHGNAGIESLTYDTAGGDPKALVAPPDLTLDPGETKFFTLTTSTVRSDPRGTKGSAPTGGTRADLTFTPWGKATDVDGVTRQIAPTQFLAPAGALTHQVPIDDSQTIPETSDVLVAGAVMRGALEGTWDVLASVPAAVAGIPAGAAGLLALPYTALNATFDYQSTVWNSMTPEEQDAFADNSAALALAVVLRNGTLAGENAAALFQKVKAATLTSMTGLANEWEIGDYESTVQLYSKYSTEAILNVAAPIALAKLSTVPQVTAALSRAQLALQTAAAPLLLRAGEVRTVVEMAPLLTELVSGTELTAVEIRELYGISEEELAELQKLATKYKFLLTVRSRHLSSIEWIQKFGALLKPEALKIKTVSELDAKLGYGSASIGSLVFKEPVPLLRWRKAGKVGSLGDYVTSYLAEQGFVAGTGDWENAVFRIGARMDEWTKWEATYKAWSERKWIETSFNWSGNGVDDTVVKGSGKFVGFRLRPVGEEEYVVELLNAKTGRFVPVTGDIDGIAFTHLDGSPLEVAEHASLLNDLRTNPIISSPHAESATFVKGGVQFVVDQFKPNEPGLQIGPNGIPPRVVRLNSGKSRWASPTDYDLHWDGGLVYAGRAKGVGPANVPLPDFPGLGAARPSVAPRSVPASLHAAAGDSTLGRCAVAYSNAPDVPAAYLDADGRLADAATGQPLPALEGQCFGEGPTVTLVVRPSTEISTAAPAGAGRVEIGGNGTATQGADDGFQVGQPVQIGAGTADAEGATVIGFGSLILDHPLRRAHPAGELVVATGPPPAPAAAPVAPVVTPSVSASSGSAPPVPTPSLTTPSASAPSGLPGRASPTDTPTGTSPPSLRHLTLSTSTPDIQPNQPAYLVAFGEPGAPIELRCYTRPRTQYVTARRATLPAVGAVLLRILPGGNTRCAVRYTGDADSTSASVVVQVHTTLSLWAVRLSSPRTYLFQGRSLPRRPGQLVTLYRVDGSGRAIRTATATSDSAGRYRLQRRFSGTGSFVFQVRVGPTLANAAGASAPLRLRLR